MTAPPGCWSTLVKSTNPTTQRKMKTIFKLLFGLFSVLFMATAVSSQYPVTPFEVVSVLFIISLVAFMVRVAVLYNDPSKYQKRYHQRLAFGVAIEFWESTVAEFLMREYPWLMRAKDRSGNVNNDIVHIPQAGALPGGLRNRSQYPAPIVKRTDTDILYGLDAISTNPTHISAAEKVPLSYDKVGSVFNDHIKQLNYLGAFNALYRWVGKNATMLDLNAANIKRTTGGVVATHLTGATGNRKVPLVADIATAKTELINQTKRELNPGKRALITDETMYNQLKSDAVLASNLNYDLVGAVFQNGDLIKIHGFDIIRTDVLTRFTNAGTPLAKDPLSDADNGVPYSTTAAATDNACMLLVDFDFVHIAKGSIKVFETLNDAAMQGDVYSALVRMGASRERFDQAGVVAIVQIP